MQTNSNFEHFRNTRPDFPRSKPNRRRHSAKPKQDISPQPGELIITKPFTEDKPKYSFIPLYALAFTLGLVIGLLI